MKFEKTQKINTCSRSTVGTLEEGVMCTKLTITVVDVVLSGVGLKQTFTCSKSTI